MRTRGFGLWFSAVVLALGSGCAAGKPDDQTVNSGPTTASAKSSSTPSSLTSHSGAIQSSAPGMTSDTDASPGEDATSPAISDGAAASSVASHAAASSSAGATDGSIELSADTDSGTDVGEDAATPDAGELGIQPYLAGKINGRTITFRKDMLTYNGRPPTMDVFAGSEDVEWSTLRAFVSPVAAAHLEPGGYPCISGYSYVMLIATSGLVYASYDSPGACTIQVTEAGTEPGQIFSGTFSGTLVKSDGTSPVTVTDGEFHGIVN